MKFFYQVITTPTADTPGTAICLNFPDKRYFFGQVSEGLQRACIERGVKLGLLTDVFITGRTEWANTGGLMGIILTLADTLASSNAALEEDRRQKATRRAEIESGNKGKGKGNKEDPPTLRPGKTYERDGEVLEQGSHLTIHGATNLTHTLATARRFVFRKGTPVYLKEYDSETLAQETPIGADDPFANPSWSDSNIKVWALPLKPQPSASPRITRSHSPRKRSLDEFQGNEQPADHINQRAKDLMVRQAIVQDMFNSTWKMDTLHETPLAEVQMPAAIFVRNPQTKDLEQYKGPVPGDKEPLPDIRVLVRKPWPGAAVENLPPTSPSKEAVCYIVRNHDIRGKFDPKKAQELKVQKGPNYAALTMGKSVQSLDGKTITPDMVLGQTRLGKGTAIMEIPSSEYLEDMVSRPEWKSPAVTTGLQVFIWILGPGVAEHPKFQEFVASMPHCKHTVSSTDYCPNYLALGSSAGSTIRLARLRPDNYAVPVHDNVTLPQPGAPNTGSQSAVAARGNSPLEPIEPGLIINMEPQFGINTEEVMPLFNPAKELNSVPRSIQQRMDVIGKRVAKPAFQKMLQARRADWPGADAEIIALGTGSSVPSKYRNVSATLVKVPGYGYYLLDCGENTFGQLKRVFNPAELREVLQNLRMIWISHLHADHHLGTATVIKAWYEEVYKNGPGSSASPETNMSKFLQEKPLSVVSDDAMLRWLEEYSQVEDIGFDKVLALCAHPDSKDSELTTQFSQRLTEGRRIQLSFTDESNPLTPLLKSATGLENLLTCRVKHCKGSLAVSLVFSNGFKLSYSGDCRPSDKFAKIGKGSTVLIHEATFQHDMGGMAIAKRHSTSTEAIEIGRRMEARAVLLTHFSQRYQKFASVENQNAETAPPRADVTVNEPADADIPFDDPQDQPMISQGAPLSDDISLSRSRQQWGQYEGFVSSAMDFMRIKVGDFPLAQAYAPAVEKYVQLLERAALAEAERIKKDRQEEENARKAKHNKKWAKQMATTTAATAALAATKTEEQMEPTRSVWSASESEEGWETSDYEA
ncbi:transcriptional regulator family: bZIP [Penicillium bovifimosum]|uniref:ribonuclease Z n=1 Tax=Penicillium bovifimosum TaxID=126998 RepID=A0A9W9GX12_9EURO|nr:transcriptional regulator family: bZIP [Penicillium bovifimosum]KAJ5131503.1 transcriptional regulator family: bZIP [Penicillium bovifimosum]